MLSWLLQVYSRIRNDTDGPYYNDMVRFDACGDIDSTFGINGIVHHNFDLRNTGHHYRITSYNVCYTKLLRGCAHQITSGNLWNIVFFDQ